MQMFWWEIKAPEGTPDSLSLPASLGCLPHPWECPQNVPLGFPLGAKAALDVMCGGGYLLHIRRTMLSSCISVLIVL